MGFRIWLAKMFGIGKSIEDLEDSFTKEFEIKVAINEEFARIEQETIERAEAKKAKFDSQVSRGKNGIKAIKNMFGNVQDLTTEEKQQDDE